MHHPDARSRICRSDRKLQCRPRGTRRIDCVDKYVLPQWRCVKTLLFCSPCCLISVIRLYDITPKHRSGNAHRGRDRGPQCHRCRRWRSVRCVVRGDHCGECRWLGLARIVRYTWSSWRFRRIRCARRSSRSADAGVGITASSAARARPPSHCARNYHRRRDRRMVATSKSIC